MIGLLEGLDYEHSTGYFLTIEARDGGDPPLQTRCFCNITVTDENDNAPTFSQPSYSSLINEAAQIGENVAVVTATDMDSGENGKLRYKITHGDSHTHFNIDKETGSISLADRLDREMVSSYVLEVEATDAGNPAKSSSVLVHIDVSDSNDNPPLFSETNYTVYVQEDRPFGHILLRLQVTDADESPPNGPPFTFDIRDGNEENAFRFVQDDATLRTAMKFNHKIKNLYKLQLRVFDNGTPPLFSDSFVTVNIIEESKYPPIVQKMGININSYQDEFPGAIIGNIKANDQDPYDQLTYELVPLSNPLFGVSSSQSINDLFEIDQTKGTIIALQGLDVGTYNLNISVSDGKFTTFSESKVKVNLISDEILEHAVLIRFASISPEQFISRYQTTFIKYVKMLLSLQRSKDIFILGIQSSTASLRAPRSISKNNERIRKQSRKKDALVMEVKSTQSPPDLEVLFVVQKSKHNYYSRDKVRKALQDKIQSLESQMRLNIIEIQEDECTLSMCDNNNGQCEDTVIMEENSIVTISSSSSTFVSSSYHHDSVCVCKDGYAGERCQIMLNECAKEPCPTYKECIPDSSLKGYSCHCPEGLTGQLCNINITNCKHDNDDAKCKVVNPLSFGGKSYVSYKVKGSIEKYLNLSMSVRTLYPSGTLMYAAGPIDYSILEVYKNKLRYRFNFGSGEGIVLLSESKINDGNWHTIALQRLGNSARLTVDRKHKAHGSAPGINDALNLEGGTGKNIYFGAEVFQDVDEQNKGFIGCLDNIRLDDIALPLHAKAKSRIAKLVRINNVDFNCGPLTSPGQCGSYPCLNSGTCVELTNSYSCKCSPRFKGSNCERDVNPCAGNPCLNGGTCLNTQNGNFRCLCPQHLSGKRCDYGVYCNPNPCQNGAKCEEGSDRAICKCRGYTGAFCTQDINECLNSNPCANKGTCINTDGDFRCECQQEWTGPYCTTKPGLVGSSRYMLKLEELIGLIISLFGIVLFVGICILCRHCTHSEKRKTQTSYNPEMNNSGNESFLNLNGSATTPQIGDHRESRLISNYELTSMDQRPLIPYSTRPMSYTPIQNETGYTDTVRSYGSAADELESLPPVRIVNPNNYPYQQHNNQNIPPDYAPNFQQQIYQKPTATVAPSVFGASRFGNQPEGHLDQKILDYYNNRHKPQPNQQPLPSMGHPRGVQIRAPNHLNLPGVNIDSSGLKCGASLSSLQTSCTQEDTQKYFWDSFDLNGDNSAPGECENDPGVTDLVGQMGAVGGAPTVPVEQSSNAMDSLETSSNVVRPPEIKEGNTNQNTIQRILKTNGPIDSTRDIETLPEDFGQDSIPRPSEGHTRFTHDNDIRSNDSDEEPQFGSVFPSNVSNSKAPSTSFEQLLASNDDINFADDDEDDDNGEKPNSYDYHLHLNNYLPQHNISEASETDEQTPMLSRHAPPNLLNNGFRSPNANTTSRLAGAPTFFQQNNPSTNRVNGSNRFNSDSNGTDVDLNQSISALPELESDSVISNNDLQFTQHPLSKMSGLKSAIPPPASLSSDGHSASNGILRPLQLNTSNGEIFANASKGEDLDNLCELEDSDCETPTIDNAKTVLSSTPRVTRV